MKSSRGLKRIHAPASLPMRGEWIEMIDRKHGPAAIQPSLPMRGEWIEMMGREKIFQPCPSLPMRGEWIEIASSGVLSVYSQVSPHAGRVD